MLLTVGLILGLMNLAQAQSVQAQPKSGLRAKVGYFMPGDSAVMDLWGSGLTFGADYLYAFPPYGIGLGVEYFSKEKSLLLLTYSWRVIPLTATFLYFFPGRENFSPYVGGGIGYYLVKIGEEVLGIPFYEEEGSGVGFHIQGGFTFGENFFAEAKYSTADIEGVNAGGFTILAGYRF